MVLKWAAGLLILAIVAVLAARFVFALPPAERRAAASTPEPSAGNPLLAAVSPIAAAHAGKTGVHALLSGTNAFAARMLLARQAQTSIDAQYYIWHDDLTGTALLDTLRQAAERGVKVRLLVDDNGIDALDAELAALDALATMEVRLFNPFMLRAVKPLNYAFDFFRLNHRMHNKSFTVDGIASVIGGRNVGDEYFGTGPNASFLDLDVLAVGAVVPEITSDFDLYWNSAVSYPIARIVEDPGDGLARLAAAVSRFDRTEQAGQYRTAVETSSLVRRLLDGSLRLEWTDVRLVSDDPAKAQRKVRKENLLISQLTRLVGTPAKSVDLVSAYFVPGKLGVRQLVALKASGVRVRIMTNAFEATDVALVHSGYTKYRRELLEAGVELYELKARGADRMGRSELGPIGSSGSSLHAKTFSVDGRHVFIGSFNFDPRSALINTEMGLMIDSETLARGITEMFDSGLPGICYRASLDADGSIVWTDVAEDGSKQTYSVEPGTSILSRAMITVAGWLPVEWML